MYRLQARSKEDIIKVINFFDKNPPRIKKTDYVIFRKCFKIWDSGEKI